MYGKCMAGIGQAVGRSGAGVGQDVTNINNMKAYTHCFIYLIKGRE